jgi:hypothetical protein
MLLLLLLLLTPTATTPTEVVQVVSPCLALICPVSIARTGEVAASSDA